MNKQPALYIDADACPVKEEALKVAYRYELKAFLVSNQWLRMPVGDNIEKITVDKAFDAADDWIVNHIEDGDLCITADIELASRCLKKAASVVGPDGRLFTSDNIGTALAMRELNTQLRAMGEINGYNKSFDRADRSRFLNALDKLAVQLMKQFAVIEQSHAGQK